MCFRLFLNVWFLFVFFVFGNDLLEAQSETRNEVKLGKYTPGRPLSVDLTIHGASHRFLIQLLHSYTIIDKRDRKLVNTEGPLVAESEMVSVYEKGNITYSSGTIASEPLVIIDLSSLSNFYKEDVAGILGRNYVEGKVLKFDGTRFFLVEKINGDDYDVLQSLVDAGGAPVIKAELSSGEESEFMIDTIANFYLSLTKDAFEKEVNLGNILVSGSVNYGHPPEGKRVRKGVLKQFRVFSRTYEDIEVVEGDVTAVGMRFLCMHRFALDVWEHVLRIQFVEPDQRGQAQ